MAELRIHTSWMSAACGEPEVRATAALLGMHIDNICLTKNQDIWAETIRDNVFVSAYPLAMWFASSWWRLNHEPLPAQQPGHDWRMAHEIGAANHGFVWPRVIFIPDGEAIHLWAGASMVPDQSVQYLQALETPKSVPLPDFQLSIHSFVQSVLARLDVKQLAGTNLAQLWAILQEDQATPEALRRRKLEAELGFDPEECPEHMLNAALEWGNRVGDTALSELAPAISSSGGSPELTALEQLVNAGGIIGTPTVAHDSIPHRHQGVPWEKAVYDAQALRQAVGNISGPITNKCLHDLLGLSQAAVANWSAPNGRSPVAVAIPMSSCEMKFVTGKRHPFAQRFELARFLGEYLRHSPDQNHWLASTDLKTSRQKYQRAFAAEFLCPIHALTAFLDGNFSSYAIEEATERFEVSEKTVTSLLYNNGLIPRSWPDYLPYKLAA